MCECRVGVVGVVLLVFVGDCCVGVLVIIHDCVGVFIIQGCVVVGCVRRLWKVLLKIDSYRDCTSAQLVGLVDRNVVKRCCVVVSTVVQR